MLPSFLETKERLQYPRTKIKPRNRTSHPRVISWRKHKTDLIRGPSTIRGTLLSGRTRLYRLWDTDQRRRGPCVVPWTNPGLSYTEYDLRTLRDFLDVTKKDLHRYTNLCRREDLQTPRTRSKLVCEPKGNVRWQTTTGVWVLIYL